MLPQVNVIALMLQQIETVKLMEVGDESIALSILEVGFATKLKLLLDMSGCCKTHEICK